MSLWRLLPPRGGALAALAFILPACTSAPRPRPATMPVVRGHGHQQVQPASDPYRLSPSVTRRRPGERTLRAGQILDAKTGERLDEAKLAALLGRYDVIHVGEVHGSRSHQLWQAKIVGLAAKSRRPLAVGVEWFPRSVQSTLDKLLPLRLPAGERAFVQGVGWYRHWGHDYRPYRPIIRAIAARRLPMIALNAARKLAKAVARHGVDKLPPALAKLLPPMDLRRGTGHRAVFRALLGRSARHRHGGGKRGGGKRGGGKRKPHGRSKRKPHAHHGRQMQMQMRALLERYYQAQVLWDAAMADSALRVLQRTPETRVVILAGAGHVLYDLAIRRQIHARRPELRQLTVLPLRVPKGSRKVSAALADVLIGLPAKGPDDRYPTLGVVAEVKDGSILVKKLSPGATAARRAGLKVGDVLLSIDGRPLKSLFDLRWSLIDKRFGDSVVVEVRREGKTQRHSAVLRRMGQY